MVFGLKNTVALTERRRAQRESVDVAVTARTSAGERVPFVIEVLSERGFLASSPRLLPKGVFLDVTFPSGRASRVQVVWLEEGKVGCAFTAPADLRTLLKSAEVHRQPLVEKRAGLGGHAVQPLFHPPGAVPETDDAQPDMDAADAEIGDEAPVVASRAGDDDNRVQADPFWLDRFGWLPIDSYHAVTDGTDPWFRPVLVRNGPRWALARFVDDAWVHMREDRLGEEIDFAPTSWTSLSDDLALDLADGIDP